MAKPPAGWIVDTGNSLAASLVFATLMNQGSGSPTDVVTGASGAAQGGATWTTLANGDPGRIFTSDGDADYYATFDSVAIGSAVSLVVIGDTANGVASGGGLFCKGDASLNYDFWLRDGGADTLFLRYGNAVDLDSTVGALNKTFYGMAADATSVFWNIDGTTATTAGVTLVNNQRRLVVGGRYLNPTYDFPAGNGSAGKGKLSAAFWWNRKLSAAELASLQGDPWQMFMATPSSTAGFGVREEGWAGVLP